MLGALVLTAAVSAAPAPAARRAFGRDLDVSSPVSGNVVGVLSDVRIDAPVSGNVIVWGGTARFGPKGSVEGNLSVFGGDVVFPPGRPAPVRGAISTPGSLLRLYLEEMHRAPWDEPARLAAVRGVRLVTLSIWLLGSLVLLYFFGSSFARAAARAEEDWAGSLLAGRARRPDALSRGGRGARAAARRALASHRSRVRRGRRGGEDFRDGGALSPPRSEDPEERFARASAGRARGGIRRARRGLAAAGRRRLSCGAPRPWSRWESRFLFAVRLAAGEGRDSGLTTSGFALCVRPPAAIESASNGDPQARRRRRRPDGQRHCPRGGRLGPVRRAHRRGRRISAQGADDDREELRTRDREGQADLRGAGRGSRPVERDDGPLPGR